MGMFKDLKKSVTDMKDMTAAAPGMIQQANQLRDGAAMQQAAAQQQADAIMAQAGVAAGSNTMQAPSSIPAEMLAPIAGVSIELYANISKGIAAYNYDQAMLPSIALSKGVDAGSWQSAMDGWNQRIKANATVAQLFNRTYQAA